MLVSFMSIGDWGDKGAKDLSPIMGKYSAEVLWITQSMSIGVYECESFQFVLAIGDNFYDTGVSGIDDPQFKVRDH